MLRGKGLLTPLGGFGLVLIGQLLIDLVSEPGVIHVQHLFAGVS